VMSEKTSGERGWGIGYLQRRVGEEEFRARWTIATC